MDKKTLHRLKIDCLCGGNIIQVNTIQEALRAQNLGAMGIFADLKNPEKTAKLYKELINHISIHLVCLEEDYEIVRRVHEERYDSRKKGYLILSSIDSTINDKENPFLVYVRSRNELNKAIFNNALLIVCNNLELLKEAKLTLIKRGCSIPLFFDGSLDEIKRAIKLGVDGTVMRFLPTEEEMKSILELSFHSSQKFNRKADELLIGVMSLQGDYLLHKQELEASIKKLGAKAKVVLIKTPAELEQLDAVVLPGGWSNLQSRFFELGGLDKKLQEFKRQSKPILAICAGMILAGSRAGKDCEGRRLLNFIDVKIDNNILNGEFPVLLKTGEKIRAVFSDAPVAKALGENVEPLARLESGEIVAAREGDVHIFAYHEGIHETFVQHCINRFDSQLSR